VRRRPPQGERPREADYEAAGETACGFFLRRDRLPAAGFSPEARRSYRVTYEGGMPTPPLAWA